MTDSHTNKTALMAMCLGIFIVMLDTTIMNIALPEIQTSLSASLTSASDIWSWFVVEWYQP